MRRISATLLLVSLLASCSPKPPQEPVVPPQEAPSSSSQAAQISSSASPVAGVELASGSGIDTAALDGVAFGKGAAFTPSAIEIAPTLKADFSTDEVGNLDAMAAAYGVTFTAEDRAFLSEHKFVMKPLTATSIRPEDWENGREFAGLYKTVKGPFDYKERGPQNAVFYSADVFLNSFSTLLVELLKEAENEQFSPAIRRVTETLYKAADAHLKGENGGGSSGAWTKVRNYFAVPYALLSTVQQPLGTDAYFGGSGELLDPEMLMKAFQEGDAKIDTLESCTAFLKNLKLDPVSEADVLADLTKIFAADSSDAPTVFMAEFNELAERTKRTFSIDYTQFTPRSHYTSSSLRRQYFRAMKWYIMVPFFLQSPALTTYAFAIAQLFAENSLALEKYATVESAIGFLVGESDDLMPADYIRALVATQGAADPAQTAMDFLASAKDPKIKDLAAFYQAVGEEQSDAVRLATKGMRFFSGKFIVDSYWTGMLTQGDEAPRPGYPEKLPPMASSLEVMALLGSDYARTQVPKLDFYSRAPAAIEQMLDELGAEEAARPESFYQQTVYHTALWAVRSLFSWLKDQKANLPRFMQSPQWETKNLLTASGFWSELRHAVLLYAKPSFAELGGGPGGCDTRAVPPPPKGYIEPQLPLYDRMIELAEKMRRGFGQMGFDLSNTYALDSYIQLLKKVRDFTREELKDTQYQETVVDRSGTDPSDETKECVTHEIDGYSQWEEMRRLADEIADALPRPAEGPVLSPKDKRAAIVADIHTGGDSSYPPHILYEGTGVPSVIFVAVKDSNGPRLTVGFTYAHYEFTEPLGGNRMTDEDWQAKFYIGGAEFGAYEYQDASQWPSRPFWYESLFPTAGTGATK